MVRLDNCFMTNKLYQASSPYSTYNPSRQKLSANPTRYILTYFCALITYLPPSPPDNNFKQRTNLHQNMSKTKDSYTRHIRLPPISFSRRLLQTVHEKRTTLLMGIPASGYPPACKYSTSSSWGHPPIYFQKCMAAPHDRTHARPSKIHLRARRTDFRFVSDDKNTTQNSTVSGRGARWHYR